MKKRTFIMVFILCSILVIGCGSGIRGFVSKELVQKKIKKIALLPFENVTGEKDASDKITNIFFVELMGIDVAPVCEMGETKRVLTEERVRSTGEIDMKTLEILGKKLDVSVVMVGTLLDYSIVRKGDVEIPQVAISVRMLDVTTGRIIWSTNHSRRGNDGEFIFGIGRETSIIRVAQRVVTEVLEAWKERTVEK